ncbi:MAG: HAD hydrolase-like protein [Bdellovibrionaceae bacterium]|nr:HAD hydrolase-like protein [Pseudobdellovibrionaceae bacterium]MBX3033030.1 HAD hydrolase-like protein [Pseudobdellovibrionaceae bacterium]
MIRAIAFDLDDTLLDTTGLLLPAAARRACEVMRDKGLNCSLETCLQWRAELSTRFSHKEIFRKIAERAGHGENSSLGEAGMRSFYHSPIPDSLPLLEGADEVLKSVHGRYKMFLVTSGETETQWNKVRATGLTARFQEIFVVDKMRSENKRDVFHRILRQENLRPDELLSVGNRLAEEIRQAKELGARTCYFEYGEHVGERIEKAEDKPDFTVRAWKDFLRTCRL